MMLKKSGEKNFEILQRLFEPSANQYSQLDSDSAYQAEMAFGAPLHLMPFEEDISSF